MSNEASGRVCVYRNKFPCDVIACSELVTECNSFYFTLAREEGLLFFEGDRDEEEGRAGTR